MCCSVFFRYMSELALSDGVEPAALVQAVAARARAPDGFYLTESADRSGVVVPLSATLADGCSFAAIIAMSVTSQP